MPLCTYESAGGVVVTATGDLVLVLERGGRMDPEGRPGIRLPKGHIEPGESRREAAKREVCEEAGLTSVEILSDLGRQRVEFTWRETCYSREESYFLMTIRADAEREQPEEQFRRLWLSWADAVTRLTYEAEQEWVRRARSAWNRELQDVSDQDPEQANDHSQVEEEVPVCKEE